MAEQHDPARSRRHRRRGSGGHESGAERTGRTARQQSDYRPTQLSTSTPMRAREVATPTPVDLAEAADNIVLVRRNYVPPRPIDE